MDAQYQYTEYTFDGEPCRHADNPQALTVGDQWQTGGGVGEGFQARHADYTCNVCGAKWTETATNYDNQWREEVAPGVWHRFESVPNSAGGEYLIEYDLDGNLIRDGRPWQVANGLV